ncbi:hypothetical protein [Mycobacterium sp. E1319]|uniref:hypothetical protein n=1 Tax=Mycobacterium sp. E1319 TaxID=1834124 RepID=UPI000B25DA0C|nr:hypothetical protein [Mycobacterium sp. E1319]
MRKQLLAGGLALAALLCSAGSAQADYDPSDPGLEANWPCGVTVGPVATVSGTIIGIRGGKPCPPPPPPPAAQP